MSRDLTIVEIFPTHGVVRGRLDPLVFKMAGELPDRKEWSRGQLKFELSAANLELVQQRLKGASWKHHNDAPTRKATKRVLEPIDFAFARQPFPGQEEAFSKLRDLESGALFMDMGTGKTFVAIHLAAYWWSQGKIDRVLLFAPNGVERQWLDEQLPLHSPDWYKWTGLLARKNRKLLPTWLEDIKGRESCAWLCANIESMSSGNGFEVAKAFVEGGQALVIVDESTRIKSVKSRRSRNVTKLRERSHRRLILSGRPTTKGLEDLFAQYRFLSPDIMQTASVTTFKQRYCVRGGWEMRQVVGYQNVEDLLALIEPYTFTMKKTSEFPPVYVRKHHELNDEQRRMYKELKDDLFVWVNKAKEAHGLGEGPGSEYGVACANAAVALMRMQQVTCGYLQYKNEDTGERHVEVLSDERAELCVDLLEESGEQQALVFCAYHGCLDLVINSLQLRLGDKNVPEPDKWRYTYVEVSGRVPKTQREENIDRFKRGEVANLVGTAATGGIGLNLAMASVTIYYSNTNSGEDREQSKARTDRRGQVRYLEGKGVTYVDLIGSPVCQKIIDNNNAKKTIGDLVMSLDEADLDI